MQRSLEKPLPLHQWGSSAEWEALSHGRSRTSSSASLGNLKVIMAILGSVAPGDNLPTTADGPSGLFSTPGDTSSKASRLSVSQLLPLRGRTRLLHSEKCHSGSNPAELQTTLPPLTSVLSASEINLSHLPSPASSCQQRQPQPCLTPFPCDVLVQTRVRGESARGTRGEPDAKAEH